MIREPYESIMNPKKNALKNLPFQVKFMSMQVLAWMWSAVFGIYIVESIYAFGISALVHSLLIVAIIITMAVFDTASRSPESFTRRTKR